MWRSAAAHVRVMPGEIHALVGENGAGKSTLMRVLVAYQARRGARKSMGRMSPLVPNDAISAGIGASFTSTSARTDASVAENLVLGCWSQRREAWGSTTGAPRCFCAQDLPRYRAVIEPRRGSYPMTFCRRGPARRDNSKVCSRAREFSSSMSHGSPLPARGSRAMVGTAQAPRQRRHHRSDHPSPRRGRGAVGHDYRDEGGTNCRPHQDVGDDAGGDSKTNGWPRSLTFRGQESSASLSAERHQSESGSRG